MRKLASIVGPISDFYRLTSSTWTYKDIIFLRCLCFCQVANSKTNEDGLVYADLERESHPSVQSEQSDKKPGGKITDNGNYADIREA